MFQRRSYFGGLSVEVVFAKQSAEAAAREEKSVVQEVADAMRGQARLDFIFEDHAATNGADGVWRQVGNGKYAVDSDLSAVAKFFPRAPQTANALLIEMSERWASPTEANSDAIVTLTDWAVLCTARTLVGKDAEQKLMKFVGHLYRTGRIKQAALALREAQRETVDFYQQHVGARETPLPKSKKETARELFHRLGVASTAPINWGLAIRD
jgi:hypothetical protein